MLKKFLRVIGIIILVVSLIIGLWGFLTLFNMSLWHASKDSEGGTFVYGMMSLFYLGGMFIGVLIGSVLWGFGISKRQDSTRREQIERILQRIFLILSCLPFLVLIIRLVFVQLTHV